MRDCSCHGLDYPDKTRKISNLTNSNLISIVEIPYHADVPTVLCKSCMRKTKEDIAKCSFTTFDIFTVDYVSVIILSQYSNQVSVLHCFGIFPFSYSITNYIIQLARKRFEKMLMNIILPFSVHFSTSSGNCRILLT
jgi:hypothetical protein